MTKRGSRRVVASFGLVGIAAALMMFLGSPSAQATVGRIEFEAGGTGQAYTGSWSNYTASNASGGVAYKGLSGRTLTFTFTTSGDWPTLYCIQHPNGTPSGTTTQSRWRFDGGAWNVLSDYSSTQTAPGLCGQPGGGTTAGQHTWEIEVGSTKSVIIDYFEAPDLGGPTTTTTSTTAPPSTTTTNPMDGPCRWEWGGMQEFDPQPCPAGEEIALSSSSRPEGRSVGSADLVAVALLVVSGSAVLRTVGRPKAE